MGLASKVAENPVERNQVQKIERELIICILRRKLQEVSISRDLAWRYKISDRSLNDAQEKDDEKQYVNNVLLLAFYSVEGSLCIEESRADCTYAIEDVPVDGQTAHVIDDNEPAQVDVVKPVLVWLRVCVVNVESYCFRDIFYVTVILNIAFIDFVIVEGKRVKLLSDFEFGCFNSKLFLFVAQDIMFLDVHLGKDMLRLMALLDELDVFPPLHSL